MTDNYNAVGETVSIAGVIVSKDKPTFVSLLIDSKDFRITPNIEDADRDGNVSIPSLTTRVGKTQGFCEKPCPAGFSRF